ncbi:D-aspartate oxidase [Phellopilus nigrolimitatus]|nr:D-aspartate oxidase [Phellopilus nigrolimitatus]
MSFVIILGAGVVGLSTALKVQEKGHAVMIVAEAFQDDPKSIRYTSHWAGAHHVSIADDDVRQQKMDRETFRTMWEMSEAGKDSEQCFLRLPQAEYYCEERPGTTSLEVMPDFRKLDEKELFPGSVSGVAFTTLTIDTPVYLKYLLTRFRSQGGRTQRAAVHHISQLAEGAYSDKLRPAAIIVCTGIGSRALGGVEDKDVYPIRGQTVVLHAPWIRFGRTQSSKDGLWTYIIPRRSGDVIVGGTKTENDWEPNPRPETTADILTRGLALCPELSPSYATNPHPTIEDVKPIIVGEGCGLRPARNGGIRLETDVLETIAGVKVPVVYNYGHGGYGYQSSWGSASIAADLLEDVLSKT